MRTMKGFTLIEVLLVLGILAVMVSLATINLANVQHKSSLSSTVNTFIADFRQQQIRAMVGDTQGSGAVSNYGVDLETTTYTLFRTTYGTGNFIVNLPTGTQFTTTFPNSQVIFASGSGILSTFTSGQNTITITDTVDGSQKTITVNTYGVITAVN